MASLKPQSKREEFRRYLEKAGVMDALIRVLVGLYEEPERPSNAIEYFLERLGAGVPLKAELEALQNEISDLQRKVHDLEDENDRLRKRLDSFDNTASAEEEGGTGSDGIVENHE
ncbi:C-Myc-binding protein [Orchesella cincta]|uniref:c-Myc-binding protein n=1 Tax=Orchesella cincta TaxID=48709 RepID=A0A1D2N4J1_ORCCI|nr:C-Myc-binding protein [Orchesella cincta]